MSTWRNQKDDFSDAPVRGGACGGFECEVAIGLGRGKGESVGACNQTGEGAQSGPDKVIVGA